jgi:hypothetical protein
MYENEIYFYQKDMVFWFRVFKMTEKEICIITSFDYHKIKDVSLKSKEDFLDKIIVNRHGDYIMDYSDLDKPFTEKEKKWKMFPDLFKSFRDEIEKDFNNNEEQFLRQKKWNVIYTEPVRTKRTQRSDHLDKKYIYRCMPIENFNNAELLIPIETVKKKYPQLMTKYGDAIGTTDMAIIRDFNLYSLLKLQ